MTDWNLDPAWTELKDIVKQQVTSDMGITDEMFNLLMENVQYCKNNLGMSDVRVGSVVTNTLDPGSLASVTCNERLIDNYTYLDFVFNIPRGKDGMGTYINGEPTPVYFTSDPQSQLDKLTQQNTNQSSQIATLGQADQSLQSQIDALKNLYGVGAIYMSTVNVSPASFIGGSWLPIEDKFLLAAGSTYAAGTSGGEATHTLTIDEMPSHTHKQSGGSSGVNDDGNVFQRGYSATLKAAADAAKTGGGQAHNNMPPYLAVYMWKRTA